MGEEVSLPFPRGGGGLGSFIPDLQILDLELEFRSVVFFIFQEDHPILLMITLTVGLYDHIFPPHKNIQMQK